jgi:hypothetical protein
MTIFDLEEIVDSRGAHRPYFWGLMVKSDFLRKK